MRRLAILTLFVAGLVATILLWLSAGEGSKEPAASLIPLLSEETTAGFAQATEPRAVFFPAAFGPHDDYQSEWWYYTGNLETSGGRPFGFQLTFFRRALEPPGDDVPDCLQHANQETEAVSSAPSLPCSPSSSWRTNQIYMAHFTLSDIDDQAFYAIERFSRGSAGLAGAQAAPYRVWLEDWYAEEVDPGLVKLYAEVDEATLELTLTETLPPVLHGDGGLSPKGPEPGNASYYYSIVQQNATGTITVNGESFEVDGLAWKDHEYSTSALSDGAVGWDWFSLQLDDGSALMFFQIRHANGSLEPASSGSFIHPDGTVEPLAREDWRLEVQDSWTSPNSGAEYPAAWRITIPKLGLELSGRPLLADQELNVSTVYWEGAVEFEGEREGRTVTARGYVELTGYADTMSGRL
jgi:predicted secreted hydrolase